jgi:glyoxylase-like metal-dependent hydrolase (beta-lactamase superfamily II)
MKKRTKTVLEVAGGVAGVLALASGALAIIGVRASDHPTEAAAIGEARSYSQMNALVDVPGPLVVETIAAADWGTDRSGLINLDHPAAKAAGLKDGIEPIQIYTHVVRHPTKGRFLIDTGVEKAFRDDPEHAIVHGAMAKAVHLDRLVVRRDTASIVAAEGGKVDGVFLTHLHFDHITGIRDVPKGTPIYAGPGETTQRFALNLFSKGTTDEALDGHRPISEWQFSNDPDGRFDAIVDVFGDGSLFAIWDPGHTAGSTAYLARTTTGPVLFTGDTCHTAWGWEHGVEPGVFTRDRPKNAASLAKLKELVKAHPSISVRLGHQPLKS